MPQSIDSLLATARSSLIRIDANKAYERQQAGALLVDIRPQHQRAHEGEAAGSLFIERNNLEWRFDLFGEWHISEVHDYDQDVIIMCSEGYTSSLAAFALQQLGFWRATDIVDGFKAWEAAGLPTQPGGTPPRP